MRLLRIALVPICLAAVSLFQSDPAYAQMDRQGLSISPQAGSSNFRYAEPNELTIVVSVMGAVRTPGRYEISLNVNLLDLIALAGGWTENADRSEVTLTRQVQGRSTGERKEFLYDFEELTKINDSQLKLQQGDIIVVPAASAITFDDILRYAVALGVLITTVIAISNN
jgi:NADH:ubiquinone oxidoreductase subunit F (NADH-binding)